MTKEPHTISGQDWFCPDCGFQTFSFGLTPCEHCGCDDMEPVEMMSNPDTTEPPRNMSQAERAAMERVTREMDTDIASFLDDNHVRLDPAKRGDRLSMSIHLRRHYGPLYGAEPSIMFRPDGTVRVVVGGHVAELNSEEAEAICRKQAAVL